MIYNRNNKKIAVFLWLYHTDLCEEFYELLKPCSDLIDIHLSLCEDNNNAKALSILNRLNNIKSISYYPNYGADIHSFINELLKIDNDYFIKIHSKKSLWGYNRICNWRVMLLDSLLSTENLILKNLQHMKLNDYGVIGCPSLIYSDEKSSSHQNKINELIDLIDIDDTACNQFIGGNMFMGKTSTYKKYLTPSIVDTVSNLLSHEHGKVDEGRGGTYCHAMERILGYIGSTDGIGKSAIQTTDINVYDREFLKHNIHYLNLRIMYNQEIYCIDQPSIYGKVILLDFENMHIIWKKKRGDKLAKYKLQKDGSYINCIHIV